MDFKQIQELIKMINKTNIGELTIEQKDFKVTIKQKEEHITQVLSSPSSSYAHSQSAIAHQQPLSLPNTTAATPAAEKPKAADAAPSNRKASPDKPNFVEPGDEVTQGKVVCIIEAMKLFNEIESEVSGKIVKVLVDDASPVEYDQPLFLVEPA